MAAFPLVILMFSRSLTAHCPVTPHARHGLGGDCTATIELTLVFLKNIDKSNKEINVVGVLHEDLSGTILLWLIHRLPDILY